MQQALTRFYPTLPALLAPAAALLLITDNRAALALALALTAGVSAMALLGFQSRSGTWPRAFAALGRASIAVFCLTLFVVFLGNHWLPVWGFVVIYMAEFISPYLRVFAQQAGQPIGVRFTARLRIAVYLVAEAAIIIEAVAGGSREPMRGLPVTLALFWLAVAAAALYLIDHVIVAFARIADSRKTS